METSFTLFIPDNVVARLKLVQERTEAPNLNEVLRRALAVYDSVTEALADERVEGNVVLIPLRNGGFIELDLFPNDADIEPP